MTETEQSIEAWPIPIEDDTAGELTSEQLTEVGSEVVALAGLHHVKSGALAARQVLEAEPQLVIDAAEDDSVDIEIFGAGLTDSPEEFVVSTIETEAPSRNTVLNRLARRAKQGDAHATNKLMAQSANRARAIIGRGGYYIPGGERDDICQDALMNVARALEIYDPARGNFGALAEMAIRRGIYTSIKTATRVKHSPLNSAQGLQSALRDTEDGPTPLDMLSSPRDNTETKVLDRETLQALPGLLDCLTNFERKVLVFLQADGLSYTEVAQILQVSNKTIDNALQRAKRKLAKIEAEGFNEAGVKLSRDSQEKLQPAQPKRSALKEAKGTFVNESDLFTPKESLVLAEMANCCNSAQIGEKIGVSDSTICRIIKPARQRFGLETALHLMLVAIAAGITDISHIPEGMTDVLNAKDRESLSTYYSPDPEIRADALKKTQASGLSRFSRMYDKLGLERADTTVCRWLTILYAVKDGIVELPDISKLKNKPGA